MQPQVPAATHPDLVRPATRQEMLPVMLGAVLLAFLSLIICYVRGYLLLYGDAVAHLGIARRILDSGDPGLRQLGGVWLPLPHLLMLPFVQKMVWWQTGLAGAWPSLLCYVAGVAGFYRLARRMLLPRWALAATAFYALNPNLLYLATTAMTEPLFLAILLWLTLWTVECVAAIAAGAHRILHRRILTLAVLVVAAVFTRYDGWIAGAAVWCVLAWELRKRPALWPKVRTSFLIFTLLAIAAPLSWLAYNEHFFHDPLDFLRGPYSAAAIDRRTSPPGAPHYRGWHNPAWAALFYTRTAQVDAAFWELGFGIMAAALAGLWGVCRQRLHLPTLLLWIPLPFYIYSVAYGSVPIFIPQLYPHSFYNSRYGMELLPALALFSFVAVAKLEARLRMRQPVLPRLLEPGALVLIVANAAAMIYLTPLVLKEAMVNSTTRIPFEAAVARQLLSFPPGAPILMYNSDHIGALQQAGIPLRQTLNGQDWNKWQAALKSPAEHAEYVVAIQGDVVSAAVAAHPEHLTELTVLCTTGQPCARIYKSDLLQTYTSSAHAECYHHAGWTMMAPSGFHFSQIDQELLSSGTAARLLMACAMGGAIGVEREWRRKASGLRTNMLLCMGCAFFTLLSAVLAGEGNPDKGRVASNIVQGIGFLGAGLILHARNRVLGLTSAATVFVVASIGMACGAGLYLEAILATGITLVSLQFIGVLESRIGWKRFPLIYEVRGPDETPMLEAVLRVMDGAQERLNIVERDVVGSLRRVVFLVTTEQKKHERLLAQLKASDSTDQVIVFRDVEEE